MEDELKLYFQKFYPSVLIHMISRLGWKQDWKISDFLSFIHIWALCCLLYQVTVSDHCVTEHDTSKSFTTCSSSSDCSEGSLVTSKTAFSHHLRPAPHRPGSSATWGRPHQGPRYTAWIWTSSVVLKWRVMQPGSTLGSGKDPVDTHPLAPSDGLFQSMVSCEAFDRHAGLRCEGACEVPGSDSAWTCCGPAGERWGACPCLSCTSSALPSSHSFSLSGIASPKQNFSS